MSQSMHFLPREETKEGGASAFSPWSVGTSVSVSIGEFPKTESLPVQHLRKKTNAAASEATAKDESQLTAPPAAQSQRKRSGKYRNVVLRVAHKKERRRHKSKKPVASKRRSKR